MIDAVPRKRRLGLHLFLFVFTFATTTAAGALQNGVNPLANPWGLTAGLPFAATLMMILLVHEMGHYLMSRYHGVHASLPYFIPAPSFIGTFGAFIRMDSPPQDRRSLFDVGAAGPLAGLLLAIPAVVVGLQLSTVAPGESATGGIALGSSLLLRFLSQMTLGILPEEANVVLHPIAFAGWIGLFVTALNLLPVGQLDGGHVVYALFGPKHLWISRAALGAILALGILRWWDGWLVWGVLLLFMGVRHPSPLDPYTPLDLKRQILGWLTLVVLGITFTPVPFSNEPPKPPTAARAEAAAVNHAGPAQVQGGKR
ncbi:MAG: site-2 protease family protein [Deltaproteobacteria bacterium]|nr:site-2 protease family protein [Deltaproteobacteria bacterium]